MTWNSPLSILHSLKVYPEMLPPPWSILVGDPFEESFKEHLPLQVENKKCKRNAPLKEVGLEHSCNRPCVLRPSVARFLRRRIGKELAAGDVGTCFLTGFMPLHINHVQFFSHEISVMIKRRMTEHWTANHISGRRHKMLALTTLRLVNPKQNEVLSWCTWDTVPAVS